LEYDEEEEEYSEGDNNP